MRNDLENGLWILILLLLLLLLRLPSLLLLKSI